MHNEKLRSRMGYLAPSLNSKMNTLMPYYSALAFLTEKYGFLNRNEEPAGFSIFNYRLVKSDFCASVVSCGSGSVSLGVDPKLNIGPETGYGHFPLVFFWRPRLKETSYKILLDYLVAITNLFFSGRPSKN